MLYSEFNIINLYTGHDTSALKSVPTAIYSFLRGMKPFSEFECLNPFLRTNFFAISVGGDADTIASYGRKHCRDLLWNY
ncbi:hypothetical protein AVEN_164699-1 [Araneus ventricosus]|uniref:Uncharacterized protein n=2 Tax=Araneus ventricosus TaxID=182803 RepID=A0A4Y2W955_ARAVE|nr:hypothetical protein AVEN_164699-1 [Araneus ventricosus]